MAYGCANPHCRFDYYSLRAICADPKCLEKPPAGCGQYVRSGEDEAWLCCHCAMENDPLGFIWRWQIENAEASVAHE